MNMKTKKIFSVLIMIFIIGSFQSNVSAYSYGDPGKEQFAEAYRELETYVEQDDWENARNVYESYSKEFDLYFKKTVPHIEEAFESKDKDLLLKSYQAALRLNVERRLHFAEDQFDDYGQAKLLLAKARGTFNVLEAAALEKTNQETVDEIYASFDKALESLGNPGLFGIGNQENDPEQFEKEVESILTTLTDIFPMPEDTDDKSHLTEENLDLNDDLGEGNSTFWLWFTVILAAIFILIVIINKRKNKK